MAMFSEEYIEIKQLNLSADFSIEQVYYNLKTNSSCSIICEGFGIVKVINRNDDCFLILKDGTELTFKDLTGKKIKETNSLSGFVKLGALVITIWGLTNLLTWYFVAKYTNDYSTENIFGVVNSLFSGLALAGIIYTIILQKKELKLQRKELRLTREELQLTRNEFAIQNDTLRLQRFENTFFQMLTLHHSIVEKLKHNQFTGRDVFSKASDDLELLMINAQNAKKAMINRNINFEQGASYEIGMAHKTIQDTYVKLYKSLEVNLSHYYRHLYHIFKFIYQTKFITTEEKQHYATLVRSQLSHGELHIIYYNSLTDGLGNPKFLFLVAEFDLMQNFGRHQIKNLEFHSETFDILTNKVKSQPNILEEIDPNPISI